MLGACVYRYGGDVEAKLKALQPHFVVLGNGCWNDVPAIAQACPVDCTFILRNMADNLIDWPIVDVVNGMLHIAHRYPYIRFVAHALNETHMGNVQRTFDWEWAFVAKCHDYGLPTICLNGPYGNDPAPAYKRLAAETDYIGWHMYDGWQEELTSTSFVQRIDTSQRYRSNWLNDFRHKLLPTEVGIESFPGTGQRRGWHDMGLSEQMVAERMVENAKLWHADGLLGAAYFTAGHTESSWDVGYGLTEGMATTIAQNAPLPHPHSPKPPDENGGDQLITKADLDAAQRHIEEKFFEVQRAWNAGKTNASYEEQGREVESIFGIAGDGVNVTDQQFKELAKKLNSPAT